MYIYINLIYNIYIYIYIYNNMYLNLYYIIYNGDNHKYIVVKEIVYNIYLIKN